MRQKFNIVKFLKKRLSKCYDYFEASGSLKSLHINSYLSILLAIVHDRKESTLNDEYWMTVKEVLDSDDDKRLLHIIDRFSMTDSFWLTLGFTKIINVKLKYLLAF